METYDGPAWRLIAISWSSPFQGFARSGEKCGLHFQGGRVKEFNVPQKIGKSRDTVFYWYKKKTPPFLLRTPV
jgi:hypothetical protein